MSLVLAYIFYVVVYRFNLKVIKAPYKPNYNQSQNDNKDNDYKVCISLFRTHE